MPKTNLLEQIIPFSLYIGGVMQDNNMTLREALLNECDVFSATHNPNIRKFTAALPPHEKANAKFYELILKNLFCREKQLGFYMQVLQDPALDFTYKELDEWNSYN